MLSVASAGKQSSTSGIFSTGLNTWRAAKRSGRPLAAARAATGSDDVVLATSVCVGKHLAERGEHLALDGQILGHGLDGERAPGQLAQVGDHASVIADLGVRGVGRALAAGPDHHLVMVGGHLRQAAGDGAAADDPQLFAGA